MVNLDNFIKGRGAQFNTANKFIRQSTDFESVDGIDIWEDINPKTELIAVQSNSLVNKVTSPDVGMYYSANPYQGCEHGCIYCYARNSFEYWGYSAGLDFETKILYKENAPDLLRKFLMNKNWDPVPISFSGNTDCYQPVERKLEITRKMIEVCAEFNQPIGIITKNAGVLRDIDLLSEMAKKRLVRVILSITSLDENLRGKMEPRTSTGLQRLKALEKLANAGISVGVMVAPIIPGLNDNEMHNILKSVADAGATTAGYTFVRLNGVIHDLFKDWLFKVFPERADKVWHLIESGHGGQVNDSRFGTRMKGEGPIAEMVKQQFKKYTASFGLNQEIYSLDCTLFQRPGEQLSLF
ncbi:PA0069 family radical SAM protein [Rhizosphaericola mali]|uniref:PA0069 family radical SAM protein n=1 Tax=Rhizosphaericola mali TaxID=2545455 RepID=A0A5P2G110_9BACT|nr:PA0069 family radical SAM protein [Rhizosphaericola mali]QES87510.1 PA0069 family radical SAM protein [Rhizosphaericola mali]